MSDDEFHSGESGAADVYPIQAGALKKGMHCVIKGRPCKIIDYTTSKTGKHGHAKASITATDIFTDRKLEEICPTSHNMMAPNVVRSEYSFIDLADDGQLTLQNHEGDLLEHLNIDQAPKEIKELLLKKMKEGKDLMVSVVAAMGEEQVSAVKEASGQ